MHGDGERGKYDHRLDSAQPFIDHVKDFVVDRCVELTREKARAGEEACGVVSRIGARTQLDDAVWHQSIIRMSSLTISPRHVAFIITVWKKPSSAIKVLR